MTSQMLSFRSVSVDLGARSYRIAIGSGLLQQALQYVSAWPALQETGRLRMLIAADSAVSETHAAVLAQSFRSGGIEVQQLQIPAGESSKSWPQLQRIYDALVEMAADRRTVVVAVGGGVTGDLAGFAAATYARGLRFLQVPTTLLSMVDSSVGGKTGINHPRGKNLIGAFHQPVGVLIDQSVLQTLPDREYRAGLAEVVKYGVILDGAFFDYLESCTAGLNDRDPQVLSTVISRSCELKADVVRQDEYETTGLRAVLNYGHTFGHAFEALAGYGSLLHGEAVSIGMICASRLAENMGRIPAAVTARQLCLLEALKLPTAVPAELQARPAEILQCMLLDKKTEGRELRFVLPSRMGHVETVRGVSAELALSVL